MEKILDFTKKYFNFEIQKTSWIGFLAVLLMIPASMFLPEKCGYENGVIENIQLVVLFFGLFFSLRSKTDKSFFTFVALVIGILLIREVNCGRTIFFPVPGLENTFYSWSEIKYGWLAHPIYGAYMAFVGFYFLKNKLFINLWQKIKDIKLPIWDFVILASGIVVGLYAEETHLLVLEEFAELVFYIALVGFIYLYSQDKKFIK